MTAANDPNLSTLRVECPLRFEILGRRFHCWTHQKFRPEVDRCHWCGAERPHADEEADS